MIPPTEKQMTILRSLALKGPGNIQQIQLREAMNYPSTHRNIKYLEGRGLVWKSAVGDRGPKSPQTYSLTPFGVLYSMIFCNLWAETERIVSIWSEVTPLFIKYWRRFDEAGLGDEFNAAAVKVYNDMILFQGRFIHFQGKENLLTIHKNSLDQYFLSMLSLRGIAAKSDDLAKIVKSDAEYLAVWRKWYGVEKLKMDFLEALDREIDTP
jgi:hypothetical protein